MLKGYVTPPAAPRLSKSKFLSGLQCRKRLYFEVHAPDLASPPDASRQARLDAGTAVGDLARQRFPGGVLVEIDYRRPTEALQRTAQLVQDATVPAIFEGAFQADGVLIRVDILQRAADAEGTWRLVEVKSSTRAKEVHLPDLAIQAHVLENAGIKLGGVALMYLNTDYIYKGGALDLEKLFVIQDLSREGEAYRTQVPARLAEMKGTVSSPHAPAIEPGSHCWAPYECPFWDHCTQDKPDRWIYHLPGDGRVADEFVAQGLQTIDDIPADARLNVMQQRVKNNVEWVGPGLKRALKSVRHPVHHVDFETYMPAIPRYKGTRPYQAIPVQWSNHVESADGEVRQDEFLCREATDPREDLARAFLESVGLEGSICVYSPFERSVLEQLAQDVSTLRDDLKAVIRRLWDLLAVLREHYYHPAFNGSYSIKTVVPALVPDLAYGDLDIQEGATAAHLYERMVFQETDWVEQARIREALLAYCRRDTLAMLEIRRALLSRV